MTTINVLDSSGATVAIEKPLTPGRAAAASSRPVALSTEDKAVLDSLDTKLSSEATLIGAVTETAPATDTASSGLNGRLQRVAQRITSLIALVPASLGAKTAAGSFAITTATDDKTLALYGAVTETAPATDTASSGLNGRLQRVAQRITSLIALVPAALTGSGNFKVAINEAIAAGANLIGKIGIDQTTNGTTNKVYVDKSATIDDAADVTLNNGSETSLVAVDATRRTAIIVSDPANTVNIRIGKTGQVGAARGALLMPGQSIALDTTAAIYGFVATASQKVSITLLKD